MATQKEKTITLNVGDKDPLQFVEEYFGSTPSTEEEMNGMDFSETVIIEFAEENV